MKKITGLFFALLLPGYAYAYTDDECMAFGNEVADFAYARVQSINDGSDGPTAVDFMKGAKSKPFAGDTPETQFLALTIGVEVRKVEVELARMASGDMLLNILHIRNQFRRKCLDGALSNS